MVMPPLPLAFNEMNEILGRYDKTKQEVQDIIQLAWIQKTDQVLDVPCGFGRIASELHHRGYNVEGIDLSSEQISFAEQQNPGPLYSVGSMTELLPNKYNVILNIYSSFGYLEDEQQDQKCLVNWYKALRPGGRLVMEVCDIERSKEIDRTEKHLLNDEGKYIRRTQDVTEEIDVDYTTGILTVIYSRGQSVVRTKTRLYHTEKLVMMLKSTGFSDVKVFGGFKAIPKTNKHGLVLLAEKSK